jgi:hypothetical protein
MAVRPFLQLARVLVTLGGLLAGTLYGARAATLEQETLTQLNVIRAVEAGGTAAQNAAYNKQMDAAWRFFAANKPQVLPILRSQLTAELAREQPNDLMLLDIGFFLNTNEHGEHESVARDALFRINSRASIIQTNYQEFFEFVHAVAQEHDSRVLQLIDSEFLPTGQKIFIPQHALELDGTLACVFLYGAYGADAERVLRERLKDRSDVKRVLELLAWLGSPDSVQAVGESLAVSPDYETFTRVTSFMMRAGGPAGREFMLTLAPDTLDARSREYLSRIRAAIQHTSFETVRESFANLPGEKTLADAEVKSRLDAMIAHFGTDDRTNPVAILDSGLESDFLIAQLLEVRRRSLYRLSDEALDDVKVTNTLINGLRYRRH